MKSDQGTWARIQGGDVNALSDLHERYYVPLCSFATKTLKRETVAEELVSSCFVRLWEQRKIIALQYSLKSYLYFMVRNQAIDYVRAHHKDPLFVTPDLVEIPTEEEMTDQEFYADLYQAIGKLPEQRRKILELAAFESLSYKEIASKLDISVNTVKTQMGRAYHFLKTELETRKLLVLWDLYRLK